jgi:hypothetical protein
MQDIMNDAIATLMPLSTCLETVIAGGLGSYSKACNTMVGSLH